MTVEVKLDTGESCTITIDEMLVDLMGEKWAKEEVERQTQSFKERIKSQE